MGRDWYGWHMSARTAPTVVRVNPADMRAAASVYTAEAGVSRHRAWAILISACPGLASEATASPSQPVYRIGAQWGAYAGA